MEKSYSDKLKSLKETIQRINADRKYFKQVMAVKSLEENERKFMAHVVTLCTMQEAEVSYVGEEIHYRMPNGRFFKRLAMHLSIFEKRIFQGRECGFFSIVNTSIKLNYKNQFLKEDYLCRMDELAIEYLEFQPVDMICRMIDPGNFGEHLLYHAKATVDQIRSWRVCPEIYRERWSSLYEYADLVWQHDQGQDDDLESDGEGFPDDDDFIDVNGITRDRDIVIREEADQKTGLFKNAEKT
jgi:hypothetical protein